MGCCSSKEIDPQEEKGIVRRESPPTYMEKQKYDQVQVRAPQPAYSNKPASACPPASMSHSYRPERNGLKDSSAQQAHHARCSRPSIVGKGPAKVTFQSPPARILPQHESKGRPAVHALPKAQYEWPLLLNGSPFHSDEPESPRNDGIEYWEPSPRNGNAQKKGQLGQADPARRPRKAVVQMDLTNCTGRYCRNRLSPNDIANWEWIKQTRRSDAEPRCARCLEEEKKEYKRWPKTSTGGFREISDMRQASTQDLVVGQYSPI